MTSDALKFIGGVFFSYELPRDKLYLFKYFRTAIEKQFLRYYYCFNNYENFVDHTGLYCQLRWLNILKIRHDQIVEFHKKIKSEINLELLAKIESGLCKVDQMKFDKVD